MDVGARPTAGWLDSLAVAEDRLYFPADTPEYGIELWALPADLFPAIPEEVRSLQ